MSQYDVVAIGADPGGYVAAIRAAQLSFKTTCVGAGVSKAGDTPALSGTCLSVGCIPPRVLLQSSEHFHAAQHDFVERGISVDDIKFDAAKMIARKDTIVAKLTDGVEFLFQKNKVTSLFSTALFAGKNGNTYRIGVDNKGEKTIVEAKHVIAATGSVPRPLPQVTIDSVNVLDNENALNLTGVPVKLGVIGSDVTGLEVGSVWNRVGSQVTILEAMPTFLAAADQQTAKEAFKYFTEEQGLNIELNTKIGDIRSEAKGVPVTCQTAAGEAKTEIFGKLIVAIGRIPNIEGLNAETVDLERDERGFIKVDGEYRTNLPSVWAISSVVRGSMLAHKASNEGVAVAECITDQKPHVDLNNVSFVIYTDPEIAWIGKTEEQLKTEDVEYRKGTSGFGTSGRALAMGKAKGTVKVLADAKTDRILGVHMISPVISELVAEGAIALGFFTDSGDIARIIHVHPTLSEVVHEVVLAADKHALHG